MKKPILAILAVILATVACGSPIIPTPTPAADTPTPTPPPLATTSPTWTPATQPGQAPAAIGTATLQAVATGQRGAP